MLHDSSLIRAGKLYSTFQLLQEQMPREQYDLDMADISISGFGNASVARSGTPVEYGGTTTNIINTGLSSWTSPRQEIEEMKLELEKMRMQQQIDEVLLDRYK